MTNLRLMRKWSGNLPVNKYNQTIPNEAAG